MSLSRMILSKRSHRESRSAFLRSMCLLVALAVLCGCRTLAVAEAPAQPHTVAACASDERAMRRDVLYLGRNRPDGGTVDDAQWRGFVDDVIVPRFPDGFTVANAEGHWRSDDGAIERESSQMVIVLHADDVASNAAVTEIADEYKRRFVQEAVLRERSPVCVKF
jgi:hypothetical protein